MALLWMPALAAGFFVLLIACILFEITVLAFAILGGIIVWCYSQIRRLFSFHPEK